MVGFPAVSVVVLLLGCCVRAWDFSHCCSCTVVRCVPVGSLVFVPCPSTPLTKDSVVSLRLNKSESTDAIYDFDGSKHGWHDGRLENVENATNATRPTAMHLNTTAAAGGWARFALTNVTAVDAGLYCCNAKVLDPPPVVTKCDAPTVDLQLQGHQCEAPVVCVAPKGLEGPGAPGGLWIWIGTMAALGVYALLVTVVASIKIVRMSKEPEWNQNDYMNTKHVPH